MVIACTYVHSKRSHFVMPNKHGFEGDITDDGDGIHLTLFEIEFQTEEEAKEYLRSLSGA